MARLRLCFLVLLLGFSLAACRSSEEQTAPPVPDLTVHVQNNSVLDVVIYAIRETVRERLGTVTTARTSTFTIPGYLLTGTSTLRFVADPIGSRNEYLIGDVVVFPGDEIHLLVPSNAGR